MSAPDVVHGGPGARRLRVLVADDESLARDALCDVLADEADVDVVATAGDGRDAIARAREARPDVVFLDLQMPGVDGLTAAREIQRASPPGEAPGVVFVTAHSEHAVAAFELHAVDYVLKPFEPARVRSALARVRARLQARTADATLQRLEALVAALAPNGPAAGTPAAPTYVERFAVTAPGGVRVVPAKDVEWLEAADNYVRLHVGAGSVGGGLVRDTMQALEAALDPARFVRVHRGAIVQIARVREVRQAASGEQELVLASGARVPVGRVYRDRVMALFR